MESFVKNLLTQYEHDRCHLLAIFWSIQKKYGYISKYALQYLAAQLNTSVIDLEDTLSFYHFFYSAPMGQTQIYLNSSITAWHQGQQEIQLAFEDELGIKLGEVSRKHNIALLETPCIGMSDQEPACLINFLPFTNMTPKRARFIAQELKNGTKPKQLLGRIDQKMQKKLFKGHEVNNIVHTKSFLLKTYRKGKALQIAIAMDHSKIIDEVKESGLRGRGGAGFPTWKKWQLCRQFEHARPVVVCNADEGEPGTFKDRMLMSDRAPMLFEGMAIAGRAISASEGIIYLRAEYQYLLPRLESQLKQFRKLHLLGEAILSQDNFNFDIRIVVGAGAYVCGEETALIESLEGKRGEPRIRPPFPVEFGFKNRPTIVNNVETYCSVAKIIEKGAKEFKQLGTENSCGTRLFSLSGDIAKPGIYEWPWGISIAQILENAGAKNTMAIQIGGPSGTLISAQESTRKICFEDIATGGAICIFSQERNIFEILQNYTKFFVNESCGCCTPCRGGSVLLLDFVNKLQQGKAHHKDLENVKQWANIITQTSRCGLGQTCSNPIMTSLKYFPYIFQKSLLPDPADGIFDFDLDKATAQYDHLMNKNEKDI